MHAKIRIKPPYSCDCLVGLSSFRINKKRNCRWTSEVQHTRRKIERTVLVVFSFRYLVKYSTDRYTHYSGKAIAEFVKTFFDCFVSLAQMPGNIWHSCFSRKLFHVLLHYNRRVMSTHLQTLWILHFKNKRAYHCFLVMSIFIYLSYTTVFTTLFITRVTRYVALLLLFNCKRNLHSIFYRCYFRWFSTLFHEFWLIPWKNW